MKKLSIKEFKFYKNLKIQNTQKIQRDISNSEISNSIDLLDNNIINKIKQNLDIEISKINLSVDNKKCISIKYNLDSVKTLFRSIYDFKNFSSYKIEINTNINYTQIVNKSDLVVPALITSSPSINL